MRDRSITTEWWELSGTQRSSLQNCSGLFPPSVKLHKQLVWAVKTIRPYMDFKSIQMQYPAWLWIWDSHSKPQATTKQKHGHSLNLRLTQTNDWSNNVPRKVDNTYKRKVWFAFHSQQGGAGLAPLFPVQLFLIITRIIKTWLKSGSRMVQCLGADLALGRPPVMPWFATDFLCEPEHVVWSCMIQFTVHKLDEGYCKEKWIMDYEALWCHGSGGLMSIYLRLIAYSSTLPENSSMSDSKA